VIVKGPLQFASQLEGRLLLHQEIPAIGQFIKQVGDGAQRPRLRPLRPTLAEAGGLVLRVLEGHTDSVLAVALTADGSRAVSGSDDKTLRVWGLEGNQPPHVLEGHTSIVEAVALTADGKLAVSGSDDRTRRVWDLEGNQPPHLLEGHAKRISAVALTVDGKRAVSGSKDQMLRVWDLEGNRPPRVLVGHTGWVRSVALTADGKRAVSGSDDNTLRVWDLKSGNCLVIFTCDAPVLGCACSGDVIAAGDQGRQVHLFAWEA
jgi:WD40 repeat protein